MRKFNNRASETIWETEKQRSSNRKPHKVCASFRGQAVAMSKLETACFSGINIDEEKVKSMVIDFVAEINKTVCK